MTEYIDNTRKLKLSYVEDCTNFDKWTVAVLPWGAIEPHGKHLPYLTDSILATNVAEQSVLKAQDIGKEYMRNKFMILPTISMGVQNLGQTNKKYCINFSQRTQYHVLEDIIISLLNTNVEKLVIINGHNGNDFKPIVREFATKYPDMKIYVCDYLSVINDILKGKEDIFGVKFPEIDDHAAFTETSLMLYLEKELVDIDELNTQLNEVDEYEAFYNLSKQVNNEDMKIWSPRNFDKYSIHNRIGMLKGSSSENGKIMFQKVTDAIAMNLITIVLA